MIDKLALARRKYYAEGIDSLLVAFENLPLERIQGYIRKVEEDIERQRAHLRPID